MNDYESRRLEKIRANQALLAELDIKSIVPNQTRKHDGKPPTKKRKILQETTAPSRTSARIASVPKPSYNDEPSLKAIALPRYAPKNARRGGVKQELGSRIIEETEPLVPSKDIESIKAGWTAWEATGAEPTRDEMGTIHFEDYPDFLPNKSPEEVLREGCFGGSYYRPLRSRKLGIIVKDDWRDLPTEWIEGLPPEKYLISPEYDPEVNKYKVSCGLPIEEWEASGWISHEHDVRGWFQWYTRFYRGRRCDDDDRQVSRWKKCVGETGRWRRSLLKKYMQQGVRDVFDDGEDVDEDGQSNEVSPVIHQTCHHWAWEVRQDVLDRYWASGGRL